MFLNMTLKRNEALIKTAFHLHHNGLLEPNTYVIDVDTIRNNVRVLAESAKTHNIELLAMTKQLGRNPLLGKIIAEEGIQSFVTVDPWECETLAEAGLKIGNVGHLVQVPKNMISKILMYKPKYYTVYSYENAKLVSQKAAEIGVTQKVLLKIGNKRRNLYPGQEGGIELDDILEETLKIQKLPNLEIAGLTAFPCVLFDEAKGEFAFTEFAKVLKQAEKLLKSNGFTFEVLNIPSANTTASFEIISGLGGNLLEPGHAISGTTPIHAVCENQPEIPAIVYLTEVSHYDDEYAYVYGGGNYPRGHAENVLVGGEYEEMISQKLKFSFPPSDNIDYYGKVRLNSNSKINVGDTVVAAFRTQIFVTRSKVCLVSGISKGEPEILGIFDSLGKQIS